MNIRDLLIKTRSYRRFIEEEIPCKVLEEAVENVRYAPSPANIQPLKFMIIREARIKKEIFPLLKWAGYLEEWQGPKEGERPSAYLLILGDPAKSPHIKWDYGISLLTIALSLREKGYGACAIAACNREKIKEILKIDDSYELAAVIAVGKPGEKVILEDVAKGNIRYYRDKDDVHHVPKKRLDELIYKK